MSIHYRCENMECSRVGAYVGADDTIRSKGNDGDTYACRSCRQQMTKMLISSGPQDVLKVYHCENSACRRFGIDMGDRYDVNICLRASSDGDVIEYCGSCRRDLNYMLVQPIAKPEPKPITSGLWPVDDPLNASVWPVTDPIAHIAPIRWPVGSLRHNPIIHDKLIYEKLIHDKLTPGKIYEKLTADDVLKATEVMNDAATTIPVREPDDIAKAILENVVEAGKVLDKVEVPTEGRIDGNYRAPGPWVDPGKISDGYHIWNDPGKILAEKAEKAAGEIPVELGMRDEIDKAFLKLITIARSIKAYHTETRLMEMNREMLNLIYISIEEESD